MDQLTFKPNASKEENKEMRNAVKELLSEKIKEYRKKKGFKQEELSGLAGLEQSYIGHLERGVYTPTVFLIWKIARALGVPLKELLDF